MKIFQFRKSLYGLLFFPVALAAQQKAGLTEKEIAAANNPLAYTKAINLQNYYVPTLYGNSDFTANTFLVRFVTPPAKGKVLRATLSFVTTPTVANNQGPARGFTCQATPCWQESINYRRLNK